jgi:hypothetical protein
MRRLLIVVVAAGVIGAAMAGSTATQSVAAPTSRPARVSVEARPPQPVRVFINGRSLGTTPIDNASVRPGRYVLEAIRPDGARIKRVMRFRPAQEAMVILAD